MFGVDGNELVWASRSTLGSLELVGEKMFEFVSLLLVLESATASSCLKCARVYLLACYKSCSGSVGIAAFIGFRASPWNKQSLCYGENTR